MIADHVKLKFVQNEKDFFTKKDKAKRLLGTACKIFT